MRFFLIFLSVASFGFALFTKERKALPKIDTACSQILWKARSRSETILIYVNKWEIIQSEKSYIVKMDLRSLDSKNLVRDLHLKSQDFFATEQYPFLFFHVELMEQMTDESVMIHGKVKIKSSENKLSFALQKNAKEKVWVSEFPVDRTKFGIYYANTIFPIENRIDISLKLCEQ